MLSGENRAPAAAECSIKVKSVKCHVKLTVIDPFVPRIIARWFSSSSALVLNLATPPQGYVISTSVVTSTPSSFSWPFALIAVGSAPKTNCDIWIVYTPRSSIVPPPRLFLLCLSRVNRKVKCHWEEFLLVTYATLSTSSMTKPNSTSTSFTSPKSLCANRLFKYW